MTAVHKANRATDRTNHPAFSALIGVAAVGVLLQALWAGLFVHEGQDYEQRWVEVHALDADLTIAVAAVATLLAVLLLRRRRTDLVVGSAVFTVALIAEAYVGGEVGDHPALTALHFPLALTLMALAVWLPLRAGRRA